MCIQAHAENPKSSEFLKLSEGQRTWYYMGAFDAIGHVVSLSNKNQGNCIWNWYFKNPDGQKSIIEATLRKYPDYSTTAVLIALLKKDCGNF
jgi:hypothetical protein